MNPPPVYMCSPSWTLLPPPSPYHPSGSSQCTSPKHPVSCIESGLATRFKSSSLFNTRSVFLIPSALEVEVLITGLSGKVFLSISRWSLKVSLRGDEENLPANKHLVWCINEEKLRWSCGLCSPRHPRVLVGWILKLEFKRRRHFFGKGSWKGFPSGAVGEMLVWSLGEEDPLE